MRDGKLQNSAGEPFELEILDAAAGQPRILLPYVDALNCLVVNVRLRVLDNVATVNFLRKRPIRGLCSKS